MCWRPALLAGDACAAGLGLDEALDSYLGENSDVRYGFSISLGTLLPYGDGPIELMNGVLKHINVAVHMTEEGETVALCVDDGSVAELTQRDTAAGTELTSTLLPNRTLTSAASAMDALSGMEQEEPRLTRCPGHPGGGRVLYRAYRRDCALCGGKEGQLQNQGYRLFQVEPRSPPER